MDISSLPISVIDLLRRLQSAGHEAVLVGGCVRDLLLNRSIHDYDVATSAEPSQVKVVFRKTLDTGLAHGTVTVVEDSAHPVEVTTFRTESTYSDGRRPDAVMFGTSLVSDLARRDFTVNAMALTAHGELVDPFDGTTDLAHRVIKAVGDAQERFTEDGLRILRAFRFAAQLGFTIDPMTIRAMEVTYRQLRAVSNERIGQEIEKIARAAWWGIVEPFADGPWLDALPEALTTMRQSFAVLKIMASAQREFWEQTFNQRGENLRVESSLATWLMYCTETDVTARQLFKQLSWSRKRMPLVAVAAKLAQQDIPRLVAADWRQLLYHHGAEALRLGTMLFDWRHASKKPLASNLYTQFASTQPIWSRHDLALDGSDLVGFGFTGSEIGTVFEGIIQAILSGVVCNEVDALKQYIEKHWKRGVVGNA